MARTQRPAINPNRLATSRMIREMLIEINPQVEDMVSVRSKIIELLRKHKLTVNSVRKNPRANELNGERLARFFERYPDKLPTVKEAQPYETQIKGRPPFCSSYYSDDIEPPTKRRHIEIIDLTLDD